MNIKHHDLVQGYLDEFCEPVHVDEAIEAWKNGFAISQGGYTFLEGFYFGCGAWPGKLRGGPVSEESIRNLPLSSHRWRVLTLKDIIIRDCFYPSWWHASYTVQLNPNFLNVNLEKLVEFCVNSEFDKEQLESNNKIWISYFLNNGPKAEM